MAPSQAWREVKALATAARARAEEGAGLVELIATEVATVEEKAAEAAEVATVEVETAEATEVATVEEKAAEATEVATLEVETVEATEVATVEAARVVEVRAAAREEEAVAKRVAMAVLMAAAEGGVPGKLRLCQRRR
jgi:hypothetical protein